MTFDEIKQATREAVHDAVSDDFEAGLGSRINTAIQEICEEHDLPGLKVLFTVTTVVSQAYLTLPATFTGRLLYVGTSSGELYIVPGGLTALIEEFPTMADAGDVEKVALEHPVLWYQPIPSTATTLTCIGYNLPATLLNADSVPTELPLYLHRGLIVNRVAYDLFSVLEDGVDNDKTNTNNYAALYADASSKLSGWLAKRKRNVGRGIWNV